MTNLLLGKGLYNESNVFMLQSETAEVHSLFHTKVIHNAHTHNATSGRAIMGHELAPEDCHKPYGRIYCLSSH
jgi:hypothetical protein